MKNYDQLAFEKQKNPNRKRKQELLIQQLDVNCEWRVRYDERHHTERSTKLGTICQELRSMGKYLFDGGGYPWAAQSRAKLCPTYFLKEKRSVSEANTGAFSPIGSTK
uniref:Uncharacterized protein n=1 Tax=Megaselia scalaris TaxID=36166 RepID=T1H0Q7_MEGSC